MCTYICMYTYTFMYIYMYVCVHVCVDDLHLCPNHVGLSAPELCNERTESFFEPPSRDPCKVWSTTHPPRGVSFLACFGLKRREEKEKRGRRGKRGRGENRARGGEANRAEAAARHQGNYKFGGTKKLGVQIPGDYAIFGLKFRGLSVVYP